MKTLTGSVVLLAALFITGVRADDDGLSLQQQREKIGDDMVRDRTGAPPADGGSVGQPATDQNQQQRPNQVPDQQAPRSTLNSPARQNRSAKPVSNPASERQPSNLTPGAHTNDGQRSPALQGGSTGTPVVPSAPGAAGGTGGSTTGGTSN